MRIEDIGALQAFSVILANAEREHTPLDAMGVSTASVLIWFCGLASNSHKFESGALQRLSGSP